MNIYYFNITYTCNSNCVYCYSYNTIHSGEIYHELSFEEISRYLKKKNVSESDRIIINGGEPFLHSKIIRLLQLLKTFECEILIYTNGRILSQFNLDFVNSKYRFIIPIHGHRILHDRITTCKGSFDEMLQGINSLQKYNCKIDIKLILNYYMISNISDLYNTLKAIDDINFNNAIHITKMAETVVSDLNSIPVVENEKTSFFTKLIFEYFKDKDKPIKIFDTCIKDIKIIDYHDKRFVFNVFFKDYKSEWIFPLGINDLDCRKTCPLSFYCASAVSDFTVLEYNGCFFKSLE